MPIVILDNFDSFTYNLYQMVQGVSAQPVEVYRNNALTFEALLALRPSGIIISPGPGHPGIPEDFGVCRDVLTRYAELGVPLLGVCLGHQGMVHYLGGTVAQAPEIVHGKTSLVQVIKPSPLFEGIPSPFEAMRYHSLVAQESDLPADLEVTARESHNNLIMAVQHKTWPWFGVQFHPESIGTPCGEALLRNFANQCPVPSNV